MTAQADPAELQRLRMAVSLQGPRMWSILACIVAALALIVALAAIALVLLRPGVPPGGAGPVSSTPTAALAPPASPPAVQGQGFPAPTSTVRVAASGDGTVYSFDPALGVYFAMAPDGTVRQVEREGIPEDVVARLDEPTSAQSAAGLGTSAARAASQAQDAIAAEGQAEEPLALNQLLAQPDVAGEFLAVLNQLTGVTVEGRRGGEHPVYAFMDPRCPFCHAAFEDLEGEVDVRWIPTLALGAGGDGVAATLLGPMSAERGEDGAIARVALEPDEGRVERFSRQLRAEGEGLTITQPTLSPEQDFALQENLTVLRQLYGRQSALMGVPTFVVPAQDGTALMLRGYDEENVARILRATPAKEG